MKRRYTQAMCFIMCFICFLLVVDSVSATTISDLQEDINNNQSQLDDINQQISNYEEEQEAVEEEIDDLDAEMVALLTDINLIQEAIEDKESEIVQTQIDYDAALALQEEQYETMKIRIKFMYERGEASYLEMLFGASSMGDLMNKANYVEKLYEYDRNMLEEYEYIVQQVAALQDMLEEEKSELETSKIELEEEQAYVEEVLERKKQEYEDYNLVLIKSRQMAAAYTAKIRQQTAEIRRLEEEERKRREEEERKRREEEERRRREEEERKRQEEEALLASQEDSGNADNADSTDDADNTDDADSTDDAGGTDKTDSDSGSSSTSQETPRPSSSGSGKGQQIADFACKYVGYPYKAGGTSLTEGADCSGFVWAVYQAFGYSLPRSSYAQSAAGREVSYSDAQPGDIIYYGGHVGIYIGNGQIVHASTERSGIKINSATYRSIITVRRIV